MKTAKHRKDKPSSPRRALKLVPKPADLAVEQPHYQVLFENASDAIMVVDREKLSVMDANNALLELTGYLRSELVDKPVETLFPPQSEISRAGVALSKEHLENNGLFEDLVIAAKDGSSRYVSLSVRTLKLGRLPVSMCIIRDVAEKKKMERDLITKHSELRNAFISLEKANAELKSMQETLVQSGKLAALGELAAGIAHELNQPLTGVKGFAQEAQAAAQTIDLSLPIHGYLTEIVQSADKMEKIIAHLRNFTRKSTEDFRMVDIHGVIEESLVMLDKQFRNRGITVLRDFGVNVPQIYCNPFQLEQVFINLATNARDAIEAKRTGNGVITIKTRRLNEQVIEVEYVDDGAGIPEGVKGKIFNPFFTTKEVGKGMGLGLSISYGILSKINASILVESNVGKGTKFTIKLPVDYRKH